MFVQIAVGTARLLVNITLAAVAAMVLDVIFQRFRPWLTREPHRPKLVLLIAGLSLWVVPATEWRLLAGMEAANGFLNFGLLTALLIEALRQTRLGQAQHRRKRAE